MPVDGLTELFQTAGQQTVVIAYADDIVARAVREAYIPVVYYISGSAVFFVAVIADAVVCEIGFYYCLQVLGRTVVNNDELSVSICLTYNTLDGFIKIL